MNRFAPGNRITLLRSGAEYFPALEHAIDAARREVWLESYIFADDPSGRRVAAALGRAAARGVKCRVLVDGWGAKFYLTKQLEAVLLDGGIDFLRYRPEVAPWQFRSNRLRRLHRKLCHVDGKVAFVGGINVMDDSNTPGQTPPRVDFAVRIEGTLLPQIVQTMHRVWSLVQLVHLREGQLPLFRTGNARSVSARSWRSSSSGTIFATGATSKRNIWTRSIPPSATLSSPIRIFSRASASGTRWRRQQRAASR